jgi:hypothetical protein
VSSVAASWFDSFLLLGGSCWCVGLWFLWRLYDEFLFCCSSAPAAIVGLLSGASPGPAGLSDLSGGGDKGSLMRRLPARSHFVFCFCRTLLFLSFFPRPVWA